MSDRRVNLHEHSPSESPGESIGPYRLIEIAGRGGFGTVWRAVRAEPFHQVVALKVMKAGMDSEAVLARFDQERAVLARMDHPSIARAIDGGMTQRGRPYFVMEFVEGKPITTACDVAQADLKTRALLLASACDAVQHAHQRGVLHRDLTPGNVLARRGEQGALEVKVIDFGVAKALTSNENPSVTEAGEMIGTPASMSPEQARGGDADTRSDVWGLGSILHELLLGVPPTGDPLGSTITRARAIANLRGGIVVSRDELLRRFDDALLVARSASRVQLLHATRGELGWILDRALAPDPADRYQSPAAFAADLRAWCSGGALEAGPRTLTYRVRAYARTHRMQVAAAAVIGLVLVGATAVSSWFAVHESRARAEVERRAEEVRRIASVQSKVIAGLRPDFLGAEIVQDLLNRHRDALVRDEPDRSIRKELLATMYREVLKVNKSDLGGAVIARRLLDPLEAEADALEDLPLAAAQLRHEVADRRWQLGQLEQAQALASRARDIRRETLGQLHQDTLDTTHLCGMIAWSQGRMDEAIALLSEAWSGRSRTLPEDDIRTSESAMQLGSALAAADRSAEALEPLEVSLAARRKLFGADSAEAAGPLRELGTALANLGNFSQGQSMLREAWEIRVRTIGLDAPGTVRAQVGLAFALQQGGDIAQACEVYKDALPRLARTAGTQSANYLHHRVAHAQCLLRSGKLSLARTELEESQAALERAVGATAPATLRCTASLAEAMAIETGDPLAEGLVDDALASAQAASLARSPTNDLLLRDLHGARERVRAALHAPVQAGGPNP